MNIRLNYSFTGFWLPCQFALHGHTVAMSRKEYENNKELWSTSGHYVTIQLAIVGPMMCIVLVDKNKLIQITSIPTYPTVSSTPPKLWYDTTLAPCPIMDFSAFQKNLTLSQHQEALRHPRKSNSIYFEIAESKNNNLWNGIGTSHAVEILHLACIHPEEKPNKIFRSRPLRLRLMKAIEDFFTQVLVLFRLLLFLY